jgi:hypothetical protein
MNVSSIVFRASLGVSLLLSSLGATTDYPTGSSPVWGKPSDALECGISMTPMPTNSNAYVRLTIKNVGSLAVQFYDDTFPNIVTGFITRDNSGNVRPGYLLAAFDPGEQYNGSRKITTLKPDEMLSREYYNYRVHASDPFTVEFNGSVAPVGAASAAHLQCGPVDFRS